MSGLSGIPGNVLFAAGATLSMAVLAALYVWSDDERDRFDLLRAMASFSVIVIALIIVLYRVGLP